MPLVGASAAGAPTAGRRLLGKPATLCGLDGSPITRCTADVAIDGLRWDATLRVLEKPGTVAALYFSEGVRDAVLRLDDGRSAHVRITGTAFLKREQRVCYVTGRARLS
jgi:hypothetical protein